MAGNIKHLNDQNFDQEIQNGVVLVDFHAEWCGPCRMLSPIIEQLAGEMEGKIIIAKVDTDQAQEVASKFDVTSIPTLILFKNGQPVKKTVGLKDLETLRSMVSSIL